MTTKRTARRTARRTTKRGSRQSAKPTAKGTATRAGTPRPQRSAKRPAARWSQRVTEQSDALDLDPKVFTRTDPRRIARSLKRSAERSRRRKSDPYRSAMSMLTFYLNRAGRTLSAAQRRRLERAKAELRKLYHKPEPRSPRARSR